MKKITKESDLPTIKEIIESCSHIKDIKKRKRCEKVKAKQAITQTSKLSNVVCRRTFNLEKRLNCQKRFDEKIKKYLKMTVRLTYMMALRKGE